ncbi:MAG TPA: class I SAM-dependent RNA methyltransferase [Chthoniobacterales bacterium]|nr:class I SAM-dependent RNA methyltransferase [Chthoniobacterales bacterium]
MRSVELQIHDVAFGGKGVARDSGKAVFVPFTIDGEGVSARIVREKKQFAEAELIEVLEASPHRVEAPCPYFGRCGGCSYQHISYEHQLELKQKQVAQAMRRIARLAEPPMRTIVPSPLPYAYRNRITVHVEDGVIGFFRRDVHELMDIEQCPISMPEVNDALTQLRATRPMDGHYTLRAHSGPRVFAQTNDAVADAMAESMFSTLPDGQELLIDAFCGAGFFAKRLAPKFERVIGMDWDRFAIDAARKDARPNETYIAGDVALELAKASRSSGVYTADALILDPPATGLSAEMRRTVIDAAPTTLIYVSCNPPTLARDLAELQSHFSVVSITPFDMFPQTAEIEVVVHLTWSGGL